MNISMPCKVQRLPRRQNAEKLRKKKRKAKKKIFYMDFRMRITVRVVDSER